MDQKDTNKRHLEEPWKGGGPLTPKPSSKTDFKTDSLKAVFQIQKGGFLE